MEDSVADREALADLLSRYAQGLDDGNVDAVLACFRDDAVGEYDGGRLSMRGHAELGPFFQVALTSPSTHIIGNTLVDLRRDGAATRSSAVAFVTRTPGYVTLSGLVYETQCVRADGAWQFLQLRHRATWHCAVPAGAAAAAIPPNQ